jgi:hypothetical protein
MIFPKLNFEEIVQVDDKFRFNASMSFVSEGETITSIEIEPDIAEGFVNVDINKMYLDYAYEIAGEKVVTLRVTTDLDVKDKAYTIKIVSESEDALLSSDNDLIPLEPEILRYLPKGKNSYNYAHRKAQERILAYLDEQMYWKEGEKRYTRQDLANVTDPEFKEQFRQWSIYQTLLIIFESNQLAVGDVYDEKKGEYLKLRDGSRQRAALLLDGNGDGEVDKNHTSNRTAFMVRR